MVNPTKTAKKVNSFKTSKKHQKNPERFCQLSKTVTIIK